MMVIHVDDCFTIGIKKAIEELIQLINKKGLELKVEHDVKDYLGCEILINKQKRKAWIGQPTMIKKLQQTFGQHITRQHVCRTPGTPGFNIVKPKPK